MKVGRVILVALVALGLSLSVAACGGDNETEGEPPATAPAPAPSTEPSAPSEAPAPASGEPIVVGSTLPLSGPLESLGGLVKEGWDAAISDANAEGGVEVGGVMRPIQYEVLDNQSDPNLATQQARSLVQENGAVVLVGSFTPPLTIPISNVAEQLQVPAMFSNTPIEAWQAANPEGWNYAWDIFVAETAQTQLDFEAADRTDTNKKVALFTDTEDDGVVMGGLWEQYAPEWGYEVVYRANFPVGTTDYSSFIRDAQNADAEIVIAIANPPDGIALWKQMKAFGYVPKVADCTKCAHFAGWPAAVGELAEGTLTFGWVDSQADYPGSDRVRELFLTKYGESTEFETTATNYAVALVLFDALTRAGTTEPAALNDAIGATDMETPVGPIAFENHAVAITPFMRQWQGNQQVRVTPADDPNSVPLVAPPPGFGG